MRLQNFLLEDKEGRSKPIDERTFTKLLKTKFSDSFDAWRGYDVIMTRYYRGSMTSAGDRLYVDPKKFTRASKENQNFYTLVMSHDPSWSAFPPRDKCIIMSTNQGTASNYGRVYHILPENNAKIGIAPSHDIWSSFNATLGGSHNLMPMLDTLEDLFIGVSMGEDANETFKGLKDACKKVSVVAARKALSFLYPPVDKSGLYKWLTKILDPKANGFKVIKAGDSFKDSDREAWTDGECLVTTYNVLNDYIGLSDLS